MTASDRYRLLRIALKQFQERFDSLGIEAEVGGQLPENRAKLVAETENAGSQEVGERDLDFFQPPDMGDEAWAFDGEDKVIRSFGGPSFETIGRLQGIEGAIDFDGAKNFRSVGKFAFCREILGIKDATPGFVAPAGDAYANL